MEAYALRVFLAKFCRNMKQVMGERFLLRWPAEVGTSWSIFSPPFLPSPHPCEQVSPFSYSTDTECMTLGGVSAYAAPSRITG
jgi:hypothetical protein